MSDHSSSSKVILALLAGASMGAIIGAGAALLLSPNDGKTNRKKLKEKINEWTENMHEKSESIIDDIEEELKDIKTEAEAEKNDEKK
jgi:gas vesicle protein